MTDTVVVIQNNADTVTVSETTAGPLSVTTTGDAIVVVQGIGGDVIEVAPGTAQGMKGDKGDTPDIASYIKQDITLTSGNLVIDAKKASTFFIVLTQDVTSVTVLNWPTGRSQRIAVYTQQDAVGGRTMTGFPVGTRWAFGLTPDFTPTPFAIDCLVLDSFDGGNTIFGATVGNDYH